ncbi:ROK family transcriptional regulator [Curtobacterium ammoniigenes]|uniref:ROK family transcriptional regulator n=1 Tax=Curtobacterium ammoniigenes TaxID=395387 RepID=UPI0008375950|nr:ROK family transcriptional regulator [Curtobacterium ammoniigenes]
MTVQERDTDDATVGAAAVSRRGAGARSAGRGGPRTATNRDVTQINRTAILDLLRTSGPLPRREIRRRTGLSSATVERLCQALLEEGALELAGLDRTSNGRPSNLFRYVSGLRAVAAIDVTENNARGRILDLGGNVLYESYEPFDFHRANASSVRLEGLLTLVDRLTSDETGLRAPLAGIGIALPGVTHDGVVVNAIELDWLNVPVAQIVAERTGLPVLCENDANATAYSELRHGTARDAESAVALVLGTGIGAGIISEGRIHRGFGSAAGEVGFLLTSVNALGHYFTDRGDVEGTISEQVEPYMRGEAGHVDRRIGPAFRTMMQLVEQGDAEAMRARDEFFDNIALICAAITVVLAPRVIVLAGAFAQYSELSAEQIARRLIGKIPAVPTIVPSRLGFDAAITGIGDLAIDHARTATYLV